jgi:hypothetical protein
MCGISATLGKFFDLAKLQRRFSVPMSPTYNIGGEGMSIETLLLILIMTLGVAAFLNRLDTGSHL